MVIDGNITITIGAAATVCVFIWNMSKRVASIDYKLDKLDKLPERVAALEQEVAIVKAKVSVRQRHTK